VDAAVTRLDSTRLGSPSTPAAPRLSAVLALPAKVHACGILCGVHRIRCISKSRRNKSQKYRSRGPRVRSRASPRELADRSVCVIDRRARARYRSSFARERQPGEGEISREREIGKKESDQSERERGREREREREHVCGAVE